MSTRAARVPQLVGLAVPEAHDAALDAGVLAVDVRAGAAGDSGTVTGQRPRAGRRVVVGACVHIWVDNGPDDDDNDDNGPGGGGGGDGGGDRSPMGPQPLLITGAK